MNNVEWNFIRDERGQLVGTPLKLVIAVVIGVAVLGILLQMMNLVSVMNPHSFNVEWEKGYTQDGGFEENPGRDVILPVRGSYEQYPKALNQLKDYIKKNNIPTRNRMFSVHNSNPHETIPSEYEWEVGCEIQADAEVSVGKPFYVRDIFTGKYASCIIDESPDRELPWAVWISCRDFRSMI